jgi:hypothetical protein
MDFDTIMLSLSAVPDPTGSRVINFHMNGKNNPVRFSDFYLHADWFDRLGLPVDAVGLDWNGCIYSKAFAGYYQWGSYWLDGTRVIARVNVLEHTGREDWREVEIGTTVRPQPIMPVVIRR